VDTDSDQPRAALPRAFWLATAAFVVAMLGTTLPTPLYPLYQARYGFSSGTVTIVFAAYALAVVAGLVGFGRASDDLGRRPVLLAGLAAAALSDGCFLAAHGLDLILAGRVLSGLCAGAFTGTATAMMLDLTPPARRRDGALIAVAANVGGLGLGPLVSGVVAEWGRDPLRLPYAIHLGATLVAAGLVLMAPETVAVRRRRFRLNPPTVPAGVRRVFVPAAIASFCCFAASGLFGSVAPEFLARLLHRPDHLLAGAVSALVFGASVAGQLLVVRLGGRRALPVGCWLLAAGVAAIAAALLATSFALLLGAAVITGLGQGVIVGAGLAEISGRTEPAARGQVASTFFVISYVGLALPVIGVGLSADRYGLRAAGLSFSVAVALVVAAVLVLLRRSGAGADPAG
jgi:MFS family permease